MTDRCRSCQAPVKWVTTEAGRAMPLDAEPDPGGNVEIVAGNQARVHRQTPMVGGPFYMPHHATCPQGREWRKKR